MVEEVGVLNIGNFGDCGLNLLFFFSCTSVDAILFHVQPFE